MTHNMKLHLQPFEMIKNGQKTFELRLYDEKRKKINLNDTIIFTNKNGEELKDTDMLDYYPNESQEKYGVLAIEIALI